MMYGESTFCSERSYSASKSLFQNRPRFNSAVIWWRPPRWEAKLPHDLGDLLIVIVI